MCALVVTLAIKCMYTHMSVVCTSRELHTSNNNSETIKLCPLVQIVEYNAIHDDTHESPIALPQHAYIYIFPYVNI